MGKLSVRWATVFCVGVSEAEDHGLNGTNLFRT